MKSFGLARSQVLLLTGAILFTLISLITLSPVAHAVTNTWVDGSQPELVKGEDYTPGTNTYTWQSAGNVECHSDSFSYYKYEWNSLFRRNELKLKTFNDPCTTSNRLGVYGQYIDPFVGASFPYAYRSYAGYSAVPTNPLLMFADSRFFSSSSPTMLYSPASSVAEYGGIAPVSSDKPFELEYKFATTPPQSPYQDKQGKPLPIHAMNYSSNGQWMIAEVLGAGIVRINLTTSQVQLIDTVYGTYGQGFTPSMQLAISDDGNSAILNEKVYDLATCQASPFTLYASNNVVQGCRSRNMQSLFYQSFSNYGGISGLKFDGDNKTIRGIVTAKDSAGVRKSNYMSLSVAGHTPQKYNYLALGDSFASGEGAYNYRAGTDEPNNRCHQSAKAYSEIISTQLGLSSHHTVACSGAKLINILHNYDEDYALKSNSREIYYNINEKQSKGKEDQDAYNNEIYSNFLPGYRQQIRHVEKYKPDVVTVSVSGNDIGFAGKINICITRSTTCFSQPSDRAQIFEEIKNQYDPLKQTLQAIKDKASPGARIYVLGYPKYFPEGGGSNCAKNASFDDQERKLANDMVSDLNQMVLRATQSVGVSYINVEQSMAGHYLCGQASKEAFNGLTAGNDAIKGIGYPIGKESYHPNAFGHQIFREEVLKQSQTFSLNNPPPNASISENDISSKLTASLSPSDLANIPNLPIAYSNQYMAPDLVYLQGGGNQFKLEYDNNQSIVLSNSRYTAKIHSDPTYLATIDSDENGNLSSDIVLPTNLEPGLHTLHITGPTKDNKTLDMYKTVYVATSETDADGDGTPNDQEKCLVNEPANADEDVDGIDDACDPEIIKLSANPDLDPLPPPDQVSPQVIGQPSRTPDLNGWYNRDVFINWSATDQDPSSGTPTQPPSTTADQEGEHQYSSASSCDPAGNCAVGNYTLKLDKTAPIISYTISPTPNNKDWNNQSLIVTFSCQDLVSGVQSCSQPIQVNAEGETIVTGTTQDWAGNESSINVIVKLDKTSPKLSISLPTPNLYGWYAQDVELTPSCEDETSGVIRCPDVVTVDSEGKNQVYNFEVSDNAGNQAQATSTISIDKTKPIIMTTQISNNERSPSGTSELVADFADGLSGVVRAEYFIGDTDPGEGDGANAEIDSDVVRVTLGSNYPPGIFAINLRVQDQAGNWSTASTDYLIVHENARFRSTFSGLLSLPATTNMPFLTDQTKDTNAHISLMVAYNKKDQITKSSKLYLHYKTGTKCLGPRATNCHKVELSSTKIDWATTDQNALNKVLLFGQGTFVADGVRSNKYFAGEYSKDTRQITLRLYDSKPTSVTVPQYEVTAQLVHGVVAIR